MKTEADQEEMAKLEWMGSLYLENGKAMHPWYCDASHVDQCCQATEKRPEGQGRAGVRNQLCLDL